MWLAQLSDTEGRFKENVKENVAENDQQRVFALKVVRKADGRPRPATESCPLVLFAGGMVNGENEIGPQSSRGSRSPRFAANGKF